MPNKLLIDATPAELAQLTADIQATHALIQARQRGERPAAHTALTDIDDRLLRLSTADLDALFDALEAARRNGEVR